MNMKKIAVFVLMAAFAFASCQTAQKETTSPDLRTFGMKGDVKMVLYSELLLDTSSEDEQGDPWLEQDELLMSFDREGRVIRDENGNMYEYDDDGTERHYTPPTEEEEVMEEPEMDDFEPVPETDDFEPVPEE